MKHIIPFIERKCTICNVLQDEFHFVIECNLFKDLRNRYISRYFWLHPNYFKFTQLLATHNEADIKKWSIFVSKAFERLDTFNRIFWTHIHVYLLLNAQHCWWKIRSVGTCVPSNVNIDFLLCKTMRYMCTHIAIEQLQSGNKLDYCVSCKKDF